MISKGFVMSNPLGVINIIFPSGPAKERKTRQSEYATDRLYSPGIPEYPKNVLDSGMLCP